MNLLEHYIQKIHYEKDVTEEYKNHTNDTPLEPLIEVGITCNCYGIEEKKKVRFWQSEWDTIKKRGYYYA